MPPNIPASWGLFRRRCVTSVDSCTLPGTNPWLESQVWSTGVGFQVVARFHFFARKAAATLLRMAKTTKDPTIAAGLVRRAADLKDRTEELPPVDVEAMAAEPPTPLTEN